MRCVIRMFSKNTKEQAMAHLFFWWMSKWLTAFLFRTQCVKTEGEKTTPNVWIVILEFLWMKIASEWSTARLRCVRVCVGVCLGVFDSVNDFIHCERLARIRCAHPEFKSKKKRILKWKKARSDQNRHSRSCATLMTICSCVVVVVVVFLCCNLTK